MSVPDIVQKVYGYHIYFWSNENYPTEPIHFHISQNPHANATKVWITSSGELLLANNNDKIPEKTLKRILNFMSLDVNIAKAKNRWVYWFEDIRYIR